MNTSASRRSANRGRRGPIDITFDDLVRADPANVERFARALDVFKIEDHYSRCKRIARWLKHNPQPRRDRR